MYRLTPPTAPATDERLEAELLRYADVLALIAGRAAVSRAFLATGLALASEQGDVAATRAAVLSALDRPAAA